jgi:Na+/proline symporter
MVGTSLSGVTFISVPGTVGSVGWSYFQLVLGFFLGYFVVAGVLLPLYYRLQLTSIYRYLEMRLGMTAYKMGAGYFMLSRTLGATLRLYLVVNVLQEFVMNGMGVPFGVTATVILGMIVVYTYKGGVKTIVWTDTLQTFFMLLALIVVIWSILHQMNWTFAEAWKMAEQEGVTRLWNMDFLHKKYFLKQVIGGAFITIAMTGLDQEMMQKNISVKTLKDAQKNMISFSFVLVLVNALFLCLGGFLYLYANHQGLDVKADALFPTVALQHLQPFIGILFVVGMISALFPSADGAITALTSSFCIDILGFQRQSRWSEEEQTKIRKRVHLAFAGVFLMMVFYFKWLNEKTIVDLLMDIAGYTYGPLLGLFTFGMLTKRGVKNRAVPFVLLLSPLLAWWLDTYSVAFLGGYDFGSELLPLNGAITFLGLWIFSTTDYEPAQ